MGRGESKMSTVYIGKDAISVTVFSHYDGGLGGPMLMLEILVFDDAEVCEHLTLVWRSGMKDGHRFTERPL